MIHPTAVIDKDVKIGEGVEIGPYARIENGVRLGDRVSVGPYVHLKGRTEIGEATMIATGAVIGEVPQIIGKRIVPGRICIGKNNVIREYVTIHPASTPEAVTSLGDSNYLMGCSHVAHDCHIGNSVIICNGALVAGHIEIADKTFVSGNTVIHQFVRIGRLAFIAGLARVNQDVPPFMMIVGDSRIWGLNRVGLKRAGFSTNDIKQINKAYRIFYRQGFSVKNALEKINQMDTPPVKEFVDFIRSSKRGICRQKQSSLMERIFLDYPYFLRTKILDQRLLGQMNQIGWKTDET